MSPQPPLLGPAETAAVLAGTAFVHLSGKLTAGYATGDFATGLRFVGLVGELAESVHHHPDIELGCATVSFTLSSHDAGGVTSRDTVLARQIHELAGPLGARPRQDPPTGYEIAIDCTDSEAIRAFWRTGMGYIDHTTIDGEPGLADPRGRSPNLWFQDMAPLRMDRNRIHLDVYLPHAAAVARVAALLEAGGRLVTDEFAPDWWVMADAEGNELCVCTSKN